MKQGLAMGKQVTSEDVMNEERSLYNRKLADETNLLKQWFNDAVFTENPRQIGFELEFILLQESMRPAEENLDFINTLSCDAVVPEVCKPTLEINANYCNLNNNALSKSKSDLDDYWRLCENHARQKGLYAVNIGTLPFCMEKDFTLASLTSKERYVMLNNFLAKERHHIPIHIDINSTDQLDIYKNSIALMGATSAFQIHLRVGLDEATQYFNAALMLAAPLVAIGCNSPFLLNKQLWEETRIPLFEQMLLTETANDSQPRVSLGQDYLSDSLFELYEENLAYPAILPIVKETPPEKLWHLRLHNGTVHRWVRPVIDFDRNGKPHLRIEYRILPAGPTVIDMIANAALFCGAIEILAEKFQSPEEFFPFYRARDNFYKAAKYGLESKMYWLNDQVLPATEIITEQLVPWARKGLEQLKIDNHDINIFIDIIKQRALSKQNGSAWQRNYAEKCDRNFDTLIRRYIEMQHTGKPVHEWQI